MTTQIRFGRCGTGHGGPGGSLAELANQAAGGDPLLALALATDHIREHHQLLVHTMVLRERSKRRRAA